MPLSAAILFLVAACEQEPEPATTPAPPKQISVSSSSGKQAVVSSSPDRVYTYVEEMPLFPTGNNDDILSFLQSKIQYPAEAKRDKVQGSVFVAFTVEADGQVTDASIKKGIGAGCDEAALKAVQQLPRFTPGKQDGQPVAVSFVVAVQFKM